MIIALIISLMASTGLGVAVLVKEKQDVPIEKHTKHTVHKVTTITEDYTIKE